MRAARRQRQTGFGLVELMVGITVGLIVVAGASFMMLGQISEHRRLTLETQIQQDLRAAADLMQRDIRRAGFWSTAERGIWTPDATTPTANPFTADAPCGITANATQFAYAYSSKNGDSSLDVGGDVFGFRVSKNVLQFMLGCAGSAANWQPLTDANAVKIVAPTTFSVSDQTVDLSAYCSKPCPAGSSGCPQQRVRRFDITLTGEAAHDATVRRTIHVVAYQRNDGIQGSCPP